MKRSKRNKARQTEPAARVAHTGSNRGRHAFAVLALAALVAAVYSNSFQSGFILDNKGILLDPRVRAATAWNLSLIFHHTYWWPTGEAGLYRPLTTLTYLFNYAILGGAGNPAGYHALNVLLHVANAGLCYTLLWRLTGQFWPAVITAALWSVHPALTESVTNIVGRADLLAGISVLSAFLIYLKAAETPGRARMLWLMCLALATTIGVFSKESAVAIIPILVAYELIHPKAARWLRRDSWLAFSATIVPTAAMLYSRWLVLAASRPAEFPFTDNPITGAGWITGRLTALRVMAGYLRLALLPLNLSCDYSYNQIPLVRGIAAEGLACAAAAAATIAAIAIYRVNRLAFFFLCFAFLNFLPASNLLFPIGTIRADRLLYLPALGLLACVVLVIYSRAQNQKSATILLGIAVALFAVRAWVRNEDWKSERSIATADLRVSPNSFKLHGLLASALFESDPTHSNIDQVIAEQEKSLAILDPLPDSQKPGDVYRLAGYYDLVESRQHPLPQLYRHAIAALERSVAVQPQDGRAQLLLSVAYLESGDAEKAAAPANRAVALDPLNPQVYRQLSGILLDQNRRPEAAAAQALEDSIGALNQGNWPHAAQLAEDVTRFNPVAYAAACFVTAAANLRLGKIDIAVERAREAIRLDEANHLPQARYILGLALIRKRQFSEAGQLLRSYLDAVPAAPDAGMVRAELDAIERGGAR